MYPYRLSGKRLFVPGFGILPYVRGLSTKKRDGVFSYIVKFGGETWSYGCYSGDFKQPLLQALMKLEAVGGPLMTCRALRTVESKSKKSPTGYVGIYKLGKGNNWPYKVTCPYETNEPVSSLNRAILIRDAAREEYIRKNTFSLEQLLDQVEAAA